MIAQYKNLTKRKYLWKMFEIIDCMQMNKKNTTTRREKEMMIEFLCLPEHYAYFRFATISKKYVRARLKESTDVIWTTQNLNNKIYSLIHKGLLYRDAEDEILFKPYILKAALEMDKDLLTGKHFDMIFRFKVTKDGIQGYRESSKSSLTKTKTGA